MKKNYETPIAEKITILESDIITTSPGTETPWYEENDEIWEFGIKP